MMRIFLLVAAAVLALPSFPLCHAAYAAQPEVVDGIAAVVNGDVITFSQVRQLVQPREKLIRSQATGEELANQIRAVRQAALKDLIDRQLIIQAFRQDKLQIPEHFVEQRMKDIILENFGGDRNTFIKTLEAQNYTIGEFKKMETEKIMVQAMRSKNIKSTTVVSPEKVKEYYAKHREEFTNKEQIKLRMIMIPAHADEGQASAQKAMAEEILGKIANGAEFERMAQIYSEDSTRDQGGDWGWVERKTLAAPLEKVAFNLPTGKISNIIELGGNYYIMKVEERKGGVTRSMADARPDIEKKLLQEEAQQLHERWLTSLRSKAYIRTF